MFGFLKGPVKESDKTRDQLFLLAERGLQVELGELCRQKSAEILREFAGWQQVPPKIRSKPQLVQKYGSGLMAVAQKMAALGEDGPMDSLMQLSGENRPSSWRSGLRQGIELMQQLRYSDAVQLLEPFLVAGQYGPQEGADKYLGITLGKLGECEFQLGHFDKADTHLRKALATCQSQQDWDGVFAYLGNLYELERYRGKPDVAKGHAMALAQALHSQGKSPAQAEQMARTADSPPVRVVGSVGGKQMEIDQLPLNAGEVSFCLVRNRPTLALAQALSAQGSQAAEQGNYVAALESFSKAAQIDAYDPNCRYLAGLSLLHLKRYSEASSGYKQLERLAPGWFQARHDSWLAQELAAGKVTHELWLLEVEFFDGPAPDLAKVVKALSQYPNHAPLHLAHGRALLALGQEAEANQAYQTGLKLAGNEDLKSRILVAASQVVSKAEVRKQILNHVLSLKLPNLVSAATARYLLRGDFKAKP